MLKRKLWLLALGVVACAMGLCCYLVFAVRPLSGITFQFLQGFTLEESGVEPAVEDSWLTKILGGAAEYAVYGIPENANVITDSIGAELENQHFWRLQPSRASHESVAWQNAKRVVVVLIRGRKEPGPRLFNWKGDTVEKNSATTVILFRPAPRSLITNLRHARE